MLYFVSTVHSNFGLPFQIVHDSVFHRILTEDKIIGFGFSTCNALGTFKDED